MVLQSHACVAMWTGPGMGAPCFAWTVFQNREWGSEEKGKPAWGVLAGGQAGCHS